MLLSSLLFTLLLLYLSLSFLVFFFFLTLCLSFRSSHANSLRSASPYFFFSVILGSILVDFGAILYIHNCWDIIMYPLNICFSNHPDVDAFLLANPEWEFLAAHRDAIVYERDMRQQNYLYNKYEWLIKGALIGMTMISGGSLLLYSGTKLFRW